MLAYTFRAIDTHK